MFESLMKRVEYAKKSVMTRENLYEAHGQIEMAFELNAITKEEYFELSHECVAKGINNPKYFDWKIKKPIS